MRGMRRATAWAVLAGASATPALAQTGWVVITHDDPDGLVQPGQTVLITATLGWAGAVFFGRVEGGVHVPGGTANNPRTEFPAGPPSTNIGVPSGGGVSGFFAEIPVAPGWTPLVLPTYNQSSGIRALEYDWTAPAELGVYEFNFVPSPAQPNLLVYLNSASTTPLVAPTTYTGTSLRVVPAPGGVVVLGVFGAALASRRHRR